MPQIGGTPIAADWWRSDPSITVYFLSHLHTDHTVGLSSSWSYGPLYTSPITAQLLLSRYPAFDQSILRPLELNVPHLISLLPPKHPSSKTADVQVSVTLIDANHCLGAVMFLFEGYFGRILYSGDMRFHAEVHSKHPALTRAPIDLAYVDNTFADKSFAFPPPHTLFKTMLDTISALVEESEDGIELLVAVDSLGKEEMLLALAQHFNVPIVVPPSRMALLNSLNDLLPSLRLSEIFTTSHQDSWISTTTKKGLSPAIIAAENASPGRTRPRIGVLPTGWVKPSSFKPTLAALKSNNSLEDVSPLWASFGEGVDPDADLDLALAAKSSALQATTASSTSSLPSPPWNGILYFPYSSHSNSQELHDFVAAIKPRRILPVVPTSPMPTSLMALTCPSPSQPYNIPPPLARLLALTSARPTSVSQTLLPSNPVAGTTSSLASAQASTADSSLRSSSSTTSSLPKPISTASSSTRARMRFRKSNSANSVSIDDLLDTPPKRSSASAKVDDIPHRIPLPPKPRTSRTKMSSDYLLSIAKGSKGAR